MSGEADELATEPGWQRTSVEGESTNDIESFIASADLNDIRNSSGENLNLQEELETKRGYNYETLVKIEDGTLSELCDDIDIKFGWRDRFTEAVQSLRSLRSLSETDPTTPDGVLTPRGQRSPTHPFMTKETMVEKLCAISNFPFSYDEIEEAVRTDTTGSMDEIAIQLFAAQKFDVRVVFDEEMDTYAPVRAREETIVVAKQLNNLEQPFRDRERIKGFLDRGGWNEALTEVTGILEANRDKIETSLEEYKEILIDEEKKCEDDDYFHSLVISEKYSTKTKRFSSVLTIYGQLHYLLMSENEPAWQRDMNLIDGICERVKESAAGQKIVQPTNADGEFDLLELYVNSVVVQIVLEELMRPLADELPSDRFYFSGHKTLQRSMEKMAFHLKRRWQANIWDLVRVMISFDSLAQIAAALEKLLDMDDVEVFKVKNRFMREKEEAWQDVLIHLQLRNRYPMICEIQFCLYKFTLARKELMGHSLYSASRLTKEIRRFIDPTSERDPKFSGLRFKAARLAAKKSDDGLLVGTLIGDEQTSSSHDKSEVALAENDESKSADEDLDARMGNDEFLLDLMMAGFEAYLNKGAHAKFVLVDDDSFYKSDTIQNFRSRQRDDQDWLVFNVRGAGDQAKVIPTKFVLRHDANEWAPRIVCLDVFDALHGEEPRLQSARKDDDCWRQIGEWETEQKNSENQEFVIERNKDNLERKFRVRFVENWGEKANFVSKFAVQFIAIYGV